MPLTLNRPGEAAGPAKGMNGGLVGPHEGQSNLAERVRIALVNNMPDPALEDTQRQFCELLAGAAGDVPVHVHLYSLPEIARGERARGHMNGLYCDFRDFEKEKFDALIITGTEPRQPDLRREDYWQTLIDLLDWAERNTVSTILSCLAAHASVLHSDGIVRHRLDKKRFGIFEERKTFDHPLTAGTSDVIRIPHSRWNELREDELLSCGYVVLSKSREAGVGLFARPKGASLFVYVQGHPEYETQTLLKEYRRDIRRFLRHERETYPLAPCGYFDAQASKLSADFRARVLAAPDENLLPLFPEGAILETLQNGWHAAGTSIYRNWLRYVASRKAEAQKRPVAMANFKQAQRKYSAAV